VRQKEEIAVTMMMVVALAVLVAAIRRTEAREGRLRRSEGREGRRMRWRQLTFSRKQRRLRSLRSELLICSPREEIPTLTVVRIQLQS
jgi:succinate dehydrogenase/fumarate reductase flavoprotein subunit